MQKTGGRRFALGGACSPLHARFAGVGEMACDVAQRARDCAFHQGRVLNTMILEVAEVKSLSALRFVA